MDGDEKEEDKQEEDKKEEEKEVDKQEETIYTCPCCTRPRTSSLVSSSCSLHQRRKKAVSTFLGNGDCGDKRDEY